MKKFLAVLLSLVMAFTLMMPTFAADEKIDATEDSSTSVSIDTVTDVFSFVEDLFAAIHSLVHNLSVVFDFDCPFDGNDKVEEPSEPEVPELPSNPEEIVPDEDEEPDDDKKSPREKAIERIKKRYFFLPKNIC